MFFKYREMFVKTKALFIAATGQNVGKTTLSLGIFAGLRKRLSRVGFIKPIGQQHVKINDHLLVDKDVELIRHHFKLQADWKSMSPLLLPSGFTRDYLDGSIDTSDLQDQMLRAYEKLAADHDLVVVEGTGHVGVGSIINLNNAQVASILGAEMVIVAPGGLGSSHDELALNIEMCLKQGVRVKGVILNRVEESKREMILHYFPKALAHWGIPLLGALPYSTLLGNPTMQDFETLFTTSLLSGHTHSCRHFSNTRLVAGSLSDYLSEGVDNQLVITPACRDDIIEAMVDSHLKAPNKKGGMILTGRSPPDPDLINKLICADIPALYAPLCSYDAMKSITHYTAKIRKEDGQKIEKAISIAEEHLNFEQLVG